VSGHIERKKGRKEERKKERKEKSKENRKKERKTEEREAFFIVDTVTVTVEHLIDVAVLAKNILPKNRAGLLMRIIMLRSVA